MATIYIEIENSGPALSKELFGKPAQLCIGTEIKLTGGAILKLKSIQERRALDFPSIFNMVLSIGKDVGVGIVAAWLYDKLKGCATKIRIDRVEIEIEEDQIKKIITEKIEKD